MSENNRTFYMRFPTDETGESWSTVEITGPLDAQEALDFTIELLKTAQTRFNRKRAHVAMKATSDDVTSTIDEALTNAALAAPANGDGDGGAK
jgi:hypothetical protein